MPEFIHTHRCLDLAAASRGPVKKNAYPTKEVDLTLLSTADLGLPPKKRTIEQVNRILRQAFKQEAALTNWDLQYLLGISEYTARQASRKLHSITHGYWTHMSASQRKAEFERRFGRKG